MINFTIKIFSKKILFLLTVIVLSTGLKAQLSGPKAIPGDYATIADFVTDLNLQGVGLGGVTATVAAGHTEIAPAGGYIITASATVTDPIVLQGGGSPLPLITASPALTVGNLNDAIFVLHGADAITIQGLQMQENPANINMTPATNTMTEWGVALIAISSTNGAQFNTIQNNTISLNRAYSNTFGIYSNTRHTLASPTAASDATSPAGSNSNNKIYGNSISNVNLGISFVGANLAANMDTNNDIGGSSTLTGNNISDWGGAAAVSGYISVSGTSFGIYSNHQIGDNISNNVLVSAIVSGTPVSHRGIFKDYTTTQPSGTFTSTISNNTITLSSAFVSGVFEGIKSQGITPALATATINLNGNTILNCALSGVTSSALVCISNTSAIGNLTISNNIIQGNTSSATTGGFTGVINTGANANSTTLINNQIGNGLGNAITFSAATSGAVIGVSNSGASANNIVTISGNNIQGIVHTVGGSSAHTYFSQTAVVNNASITNNTFTNLLVNTTGTTQFINQGYSIPTVGQLVISDNSIVTGYSRIGATGSVVVTTTNSISGTGSVNNYINNNFSNITLAGSTTFTGFNNTDGGTGSTKTITGNTFNNISVGTGTVNCMNFTYWNGVSTLSNNTITNITGQGNVTGVTIGSASNSATSITVNGNTITGLNSTGTGGTVTGLTCSNTSTLINISNNTINTLSSTGTSSAVSGVIVTGAANTSVFGNVVNGISSSGATSPLVRGIAVTGGSTVNVSKNKIYDLSVTAAVSATNGAVSGILISSGSTVNAYNNLIGDLKAPLANLTDAIRGINITSVATATYRVYYNTIDLNATSSGANFGTTGLFHTASGTATIANLDVRNNIIINESVAAGTGLVVAYRRSGVALNNYATTSNKNLFYAGVSSATNLIFTDGTTPQMTFSGFQTAVAAREINSITGEGFVYTTPGSFFISLTGTSSDFLRPVAGITTQVESGAIQITVPSITDDYASIVRAGNIGYLGTGTNPDMGAFEFNGITLAPVVVLNSVAPGTATLCTTTARLVSVNITTVSGTITGAMLNYSFNGTPQTPIVMVNTLGTTWEATLPVATPANAAVTWSVVADNSIPLSTTFLGTSYFDEPLFDLVGTATATPSIICNGETSTISVVLSNPAAPATYTAPPAITNPTTDEDLGNVTITQGVTTVLNNSSAMNSLTGTIGVASGTIGSYSNFTAFGPYNMEPGLTYNFSLSSLQAVGTFGNSMAIYIDYNRNGLFNDPGEKVYAATITTLGAHTETGSFIVPANAATGVTRMRVMCNEGLITSPTQTFSWGEYEEYTINIAPAITLVTWSDGVGTIGTGTSLVVSPTATTTYSAEITALGCIYSPDPTTTVTVNPLPSAPTANNSVQCGIQIPTASITSTTGAPTPTFNWYDAPTAGTLMQSSTATTFASSISITTIFYVSEVDGVTGCESTRIPVTANVNTPDAVAAVASLGTICLGTTVDLTASNTNPFPVQTYTYTWTGVAGSGADVALIGSTVNVLPSAAGVYTYDLTAVDGGCTAINQVNVTVEAFDITVTPVDITCNGLIDGTFTIASSNCGTLPFTYSIDAGPFGALPTNLAAGTYTIVVLDGNGYASAGQNITIVEPTIIVNAPVGIGAIVCQDDLSALVDATATSSITTGSIVVTFDVSAQPIEINAAPGNIMATAIYSLPVGATVTGGTLNYNNLTAIGGSWMSDIRLGFSGAVINAAAQGTGSTGASGTFNYTRAIPAIAINPAGGSVNLLYWDLFSDNIGSEATFPTGTGVATLTINYTTPTPTTVSWWDAPTSGTQLGAGSPFETVGTTVLPSTATPGSYTVYAQGQFGPCGSSSRTPVIVDVLPSSYSSVTASQCDSYTLNSITYTSTGIYTQTLVNMIGCDSIITLDLTIFDASASTTTISACDTYVWTDGNTYVTGGIFTQTLVNSLGCDSIATLDLTLVTTPIATVVNNGDGTITSSFGTTYEWVDCGTLTTLIGETNQTVTIVANGSYAVVVTLGGVCSDTSDCVLISNIGVEESENVAFNVYPNPTRDQVTITMNASVAMVELMDAQGKLLAVITVENGGIVDLSNYDRGVYYLRIKTDKDSSLERIVKQ